MYKVISPVFTLFFLMSLFFQSLSFSKDIHCNNKILNQRSYFLTCSQFDFEMEQNARDGIVNIQDRNFLVKKIEESKKIAKVNSQQPIRTIQSQKTKCKACDINKDEKIDEADLKLFDLFYNKSKSN